MIDKALALAVRLDGDEFKAAALEVAAAAETMRKAARAAMRAAGRAA